MEQPTHEATINQLLDAIRSLHLNNAVLRAALESTTQELAVARERVNDLMSEIITPTPAPEDVSPRFDAVWE